MTGIAQKGDAGEALMRWGGGGMEDYWRLSTVDGSAQGDLVNRQFFLHVFLKSNLLSCCVRSNADSKSSLFVCGHFVPLWFFAFSV